MIRKLIAVASILLGSAASLPAAPAKDTHPVYTDPASAGPDFATQGEYVTDSSAKEKFGAQVVALGDGNFQVVLLAGGLPGAGWDGKGRTELKAKGDGASTTIDPSDGYSGSIGDGKLSLKSAAGNAISLARTERNSPRLGAKPADGATVLFDGTSADAFEGGKIDQHMCLVQGARTKKKYQDFVLHAEFMLPFKPFGRDQDRGNSGIYIQDRYEVQILDTFGHPAEFNGIGSLYRQKAPLLNMCLPPLTWQTYDIDFHAPKFDAEGKKTQNARITVILNGVTVQDNYQITAKTGAGKPEGPQPGPIYFQDHHNPVVFRNIWIVEK